MSTLYNKYRPKLFADVIGQEPIKLTIQHELSSNNISHAFLFCGPRGVGKTSMARLIARALNCHNRKENFFEPCNECQACLDMLNARSLSIIEIDAASHTGVDNIRDNIIANARTVAGSEKFKVFIIDEVHMLSTPAFNALLKILEEPPLNVVFILATTEVHKIPLTIISRCQRFDFRKPNAEELVARLAKLSDMENRRVDDEVLQSIVRHTGGYVRDAESLLSQIFHLDEEHITLENASIVLPKSNLLQVLVLAEHLAQAEIKEAILLINTLFENGVSLMIFIDEIIEFYRSLLLIRTGNMALDDLLYSLDLRERIKKLLEKIDENKILALLDLWLKTREKMKITDIDQLPFEMAIVQHCVQ